MEGRTHLYGLLADLLEYPRPDLQQRAAICRDLLSEAGIRAGTRHQTSGTTEGMEASAGCSSGSPAETSSVDRRGGPVWPPRDAARTEGAHLGAPLRSRPPGQFTPNVEASTPGGRDRSEGCLEADSLMEQFFSFVEGASPDKIEEVYTSTFDLNPVCYPYVGYHLFGNDPQRAELMVKLQASYREVGLATGGELPDHVALMLRYLSRVHDPGVESEMTELLLEPALQKMAESLDGNNPYGNIVRSAWCVLRPSHSALRTTE